MEIVRFGGDIFILFYVFLFCFWIILTIDSFCWSLKIEREIVWIVFNAPMKNYTLILCWPQEFLGKVHVLQVQYNVSSFSCSMTWHQHFFFGSPSVHSFYLLEIKKVFPFCCEPYIGLTHVNLISNIYFYSSQEQLVPIQHHIGFRWYWGNF